MGLRALLRPAPMVRQRRQPIYRLYGRLEPASDVTHVTIRVELVSSNPVVWIGAELTILDRTIDKLMQVGVDLIEYAIKRSSDVSDDDDDPFAGLPFVPSALDSGVEQRLSDARRTLGRLSGDEDLSDRMVDYLKRVPNDFLGRIPPLELAHAWRADANRIVDLFLAAHRAGLLSLRWEILCPRCRNSKTPSLSLDELPTEEIHCRTCNIDYERDFSHNVELLFAPEPWLHAGRVDDTARVGSAPHGARCRPHHRSTEFRQRLPRSRAATRGSTRHRL